MFKNRSLKNFLHYLASKPVPRSRDLRETAFGPQCAPNRWPGIFQFSLLVILLVPFFSVIPAHAEDKKPTPMQDMVVVSSPIIEGNQVDPFAGSKTVVGQDQIDDLNAQDLSTALRRTPGVNISRYNTIGAFGGGEGGGVFIRGMGSSRPGSEIKTYIDGVPMYMSVWNHPLLDLMAIDSAQAIEVYKSPQPQHFGNAFAAVNIVPGKKVEDGFSSKAQTAYGTDNTFIGKAEHGGKTGNIDYFIGGGYRSSDGHRDNAGGRMKNVYGRFGYRISEHFYAHAFGLWTDNTADDPGPEGGSAADRDGTYETRAGLIIATLDHKFDQVDGYIKVYRNAGEGDWLNQAGPDNDLFNDFEYYGVKVREHLFLGAIGEFTAGLDWDYTEGSFERDYDDGTKDAWDGHDFTIVSPYASWHRRFENDRGLYITPSAGVRYYDHTDFEAQWAPHAGIVAGIENLELHAGYSRGVVYPGLEVAVLSEKVIPALGQSWKDLTPETSDHYEVGFRYDVAAWIGIDVTGFYDRGKDRYVIVPPPPPPPIFDNIESYTIKGIETAVNVHPHDTLSLFAGVTWLDTDPDDLPYSPETTVSAGLGWQPFPFLKINLDGEYLGKMNVNSQARRDGAQNTAQVDDYVIINGKISCLFNYRPWNIGGEVYVAGENITDTSYEYLPGYPMPGISAMVGCKVEF